MPDDRPHSAEQFGAQRDFWWHRDFLDLMAARWRLAEASSLADIGCGLCHWSRLLYPYLRGPARFAGVDREARWCPLYVHGLQRHGSRTDRPIKLRAGKSRAHEESPCLGRLLLGTSQRHLHIGNSSTGEQSIRSIGPSHKGFQNLFSNGVRGRHYARFFEKLD